MNLAQSYGFIDWRIGVILGCWLNVTTIVVFTLIYLNYVPERSSFRIKLVGVTLSTVLAFLTGIAWLISPVYVAAYNSEHKIASETSFRFEPQSDGSYRMEETVYQFDKQIGTKVSDFAEPVILPFSLPFFGTKQSKIHMSHSGMVGFEQMPLWRDVQHRFGPQPAIFIAATALKEISGQNTSGVFVSNQPTQTTVTWNNLVSEFSDDERYTFQLKLYSTGVIEFAYALVPKRPRYDTYRAHSAPIMSGIVPDWEGRNVEIIEFAALPLVGAPGAGLIEYHRLEFLSYLDQIYRPIAYFCFAASLMVLIIFPYFFTINLDQPLKNLLHGVQQILGGKLATSIEISYRDEI